MKIVGFELWGPAVKCSKPSGHMEAQKKNDKLHNEKYYVTLITVQEVLLNLTVYYQNPVSLYKILPLLGGSVRQTSRQKCVSKLILNVPSFQTS